MNQKCYTLWTFPILLLLKMDISAGHFLCGVIGGSQFLHELYLSCYDLSIVAVRACVTEILYAQW